MIELFLININGREKLLLLLKKVSNLLLLFMITINYILDTRKKFIFKKESKGKEPGNHKGQRSTC